MRFKARASVECAVTMKVLVLHLVVELVLVVGVCSRANENRDFWFTEGQKALKDAVKLRPNMGVAKNVIMFLGDGMSVPTITAARILKGQKEGGTGEEYRLNMEKMPYTGLAKTYNTDRMVPDSAGTATAYWSGVKTNMGVLGVDQTVKKGDCTNLEKGKLKTIADWTLKEGKSVGIVSTARVTHASPGAGYAKIPHREWENDATMSGVKGCDGVKDIARQLVEDYDGIRVVMGGGRGNLLNQSAGGNRLDGRNLIQAWKDKQDAKKAKWAYVKNNDELKAMPKDTEYLLGLFNWEHMSYDDNRTHSGPDSEPSISDMVEKAIQILSKNDKGYFLFVEGAKIDIAHHDNLAHESLTDTIAFDDAIGLAVKQTNEKDTLILVTADHAHTFTQSGYPMRGQNILGKMTFDGGVPAEKKPLDGWPMTILSYANGPGPQRTNLTNNDTTVKFFQYPNGVPLSRETHGGDDVAVFARGPMSHLVGGVHEQNVLAHIMAFASCVGHDKSLCADASKAQSDDDPNAAVATTGFSRFVVCVVVMISVMIGW